MRKKVIALCAMLSVLTLTAEAQQLQKAPRIGVLLPGTGSTHKIQIDAFLQGLHELGYVEGKNILLEYRYAEGKPDRQPNLAVEIVRLRPDVILVASTGFAAVAKEATSTIPIVVGGAGDLIGTGVVSSLARPGGNITGLTSISPDLSGKRLELLKEVMPKASRMAVLWHSYAGSQDEDEVKETEIAAQALKIKLQLVRLEVLMSLTKPLLR